MFRPLLIVGYTLINEYKNILLKPKEKSVDHIKNLVINEEKLSDLMENKEK